MTLKLAVIGEYGPFILAFTKHFVRRACDLNFLIGHRLHERLDSDRTQLGHLDQTRRLLLRRQRIEVLSELVSQPALALR